MQWPGSGVQTIVRLGGGLLGISAGPGVLEGCPFQQEGGDTSLGSSKLLLATRFTCLPTSLGLSSGTVHSASHRSPAPTCPGEQGWGEEGNNLPLRISAAADNHPFCLNEGPSAPDLDTSSLRNSSALQKWHFTSESPRLAFTGA